MESRTCIICGKVYLWDHDCGSDLNCCSSECEDIYTSEGAKDPSDPDNLDDWDDLSDQDMFQQDDEAYMKWYDSIK